MSTAYIYGKALIGYRQSVLADSLTPPTFTDYIKQSYPPGVVVHSDVEPLIVNTTDLENGCIVVAKKRIRLSTGKYLNFFRWDWTDWLNHDNDGSQQFNIISIPANSVATYIAVYGDIYKKNIWPNDKLEKLMKKIQDWEPE